MNIPLRKVDQKQSVVEQEKKSSTDLQPIDRADLLKKYEDNFKKWEKFRNDNPDGQDKKDLQNRDEESKQPLGGVVGLRCSESSLEKMLAYFKNP